MKLFKSEDLKEIAGLIARISAGEQSLMTAIAIYNTILESAIDDLKSEIADYNEILESVVELVERVSGDANDYISERTEKWQESDKGQAYQEAVSEWESFDIPTIEVDFPDPIDEDQDGFGLADSLAELPIDI